MEYYKQSILKMLGQIENERFLCQIWTILRCHIRRKGGAV